MSFFDTHLSTCTPLKACLKCEFLDLIKTNLTDSDRYTFIQKLDEVLEAHLHDKQITEKHAKHDLLEMRWREVLRLRPRTVKYLEAQPDIVTIKDLISKSESDLLGIHLFGKNCLNDVRNELEERGLHLRRPSHTIQMGIEQH